MLHWRKAPAKYQQLPAKVVCVPWLNAFKSRLDKTLATIEIWSQYTGNGGCNLNKSNHRWPGLIQASQPNQIRSWWLWDFHWNTLVFWVKTDPHCCKGFPSYHVKVAVFEENITFSIPQRLHIDVLPTAPICRLWFEPRRRTPSEMECHV